MVTQSCIKIQETLWRPCLPIGCGLIGHKGVAAAQEVMTSEKQAETRVVFKYAVSTTKMWWILYDVTLGII